MLTLSYSTQECELCPAVEGRMAEFDHGYTGALYLDCINKMLENCAKEGANDTDYLTVSSIVVAKPLIEVSGSTIESKRTPPVAILFRRRS